MFGDRTLHTGAARELYDAEPMFRSALERGARIVEQLLDADPLPALIGAELATRIEFPQTSAILLQYALHALLEHWGVIPALVFGSSAGEYAAACAAGALGWHDALQLVARRELLLKSLVPGARVRQTLHQFKAALDAVKYSPPSLPLMAAGLGRLVATDETLDRKYWLDNLYSTPDAERGAAALHRAAPEIRLDLAAHSCEYRKLLQTVAVLYEHGIAINFRAFHAGFEREKLALPTYPFQRQRCWLDLVPPSGKLDATPQAIHPYLRVRPAESR
jgi:acyl transferase domain-containing protein